MRVSWTDDVILWACVNTRILVLPAPQSPRVTTCYNKTPKLLWLLSLLKGSAGIIPWCCSDCVAETAAPQGLNWVCSTQVDIIIPMDLYQKEVLIDLVTGWLLLHIFLICITCPPTMGHSSGWKMAASASWTSSTGAIWWTYQTGTSWIFTRKHVI